MENKMLAVMFVMLGGLSIFAFIATLLFYVTYKGVYGGLFMSEIDFFLKGEIIMMAVFPILAFFVDKGDSKK